MDKEELDKLMIYNYWMEHQYNTCIDCKYGIMKKYNLQLKHRHLPICKKSGFPIIYNPKFIHWCEDYDSVIKNIILLRPGEPRL